MRFFFLILFIPLVIEARSKESPIIDIYLLKNEIRPYVNEKIPKKFQGLSSQFNVTEKDLADTAFIADSEILSYDSTQFEITFSEIASQKINSLRGDALKGTQFVLTVDKKPVICGYFVGALTSQGFLAYTIVTHSLNKRTLRIHKCLPEGIFEIEELRNSLVLLNAFRSSNRLK